MLLRAKRNEEKRIISICDCNQFERASASIELVYKVQRDMKSANMRLECNQETYTKYSKCTSLKAKRKVEERKPKLCCGCTGTSNCHRYAQHQMNCYSFRMVQQLEFVPNVRCHTRKRWVNEESLIIKILNTRNCAW